MIIQTTFLTRVAAAISIAAHIAAIAVSFSYAGAGLFDSAVPEAVPVSLVTPDDVADSAPLPLPPDTTDTGKLGFRLSRDSQPSQTKSPAPSAQNNASPPAGEPQVSPQGKAKLEATQPAYTTPMPDISLRYQVDLGLKALAAIPQAEARRSGAADFDDQSVSKANIDASGIAVFRKRLKECGALPATIQPTEKVVIVLRATFTPDGRLATTPALIEASASAKGPALMQAAIAALQKCQPHNALPAEKFAEWRMLDLRFTPQDFTKG